MKHLNKTLIQIFIGIIIIVIMLYTQIDITLKFNGKELKEGIWQKIGKGLKTANAIKEVIK